jgi:uncharacterized protein
MYVSEVNIYPIKSLKGIGLEQATVQRRGLQLDRRWMLTDRNNRFFTQREFPRMATLRVQAINSHLVVSSPDAGEIEVPGEPRTGDLRQVTIWQSVCPGEVYPEAMNQWFSRALETDCQLVYMPDDSERKINSRFDRGDEIVSFADGYPLMLLSEASLADLNSRLESPVPMNRFRPNIVVSGSTAFAEDSWTRIRIGEVTFRSTKPCDRCVVTTVDQSLGEKTGKEPLRTLASYRLGPMVMPDRLESLGMPGTSVLFGQNLVPENPGGSIRVGDEVEVLD